ncbi:MAG: DNA cytosine methyltransferase [Candidatus Marinimicrobia bacterium]|nr:DNA cytosine methyltransferase [FCB group bacterium]MBL7046693.1 DNA cytosine methyltransferase [Candidatus Neomarinimicrobiota bacterium]
MRVKRPDRSPSLVALNTTQTPIIGWEKRYLTVAEAARLQSMEDLTNLPDTSSTMRALGNAVNVTVVRAVLQNLVS